MQEPSTPKKKKTNKRPGKRDRERLAAEASATVVSSSSSSRDTIQVIEKVSYQESNPNSKRTRSVQDEAVNDDYQFEVDYNDHFETPLRAYQDLLPCLQSMCNELIQRKAIDNVILYDPYWCQGQMRALLHSLGLNNVINQNRDFYEDIASNILPVYDVLVTNPPYSGDHKVKLLNFLSSSQHLNRPAALLLPAYTAGKSYWREYISNTTQTISYILPQGSYEYTHPEGTGHDLPPFYSIWFLIGFPEAQVLRAKVSSFSCNIVTNVEELAERGLVQLKRKNSRQRKASKKRNESFVRK
jgi:hypothetical protein